MTTRQEVLAYCMTFQEVYLDAPFHDDILVNEMNCQIYAACFIS